MLVQDLFPELAAQIRRDLRSLKRSDLAEQVERLQVLDRCRCGSIVCGTFYTQSIEVRKRMPMHASDIMLDCGATITEVDSKIVAVETLDPQVTEILRQAIP